MSARMIIDTHVHIYPEGVKNDPFNWGISMMEPHWAHTVAPPGQKSIQGWADIQQLLRDMDAANIEKAVLLGWYWQQQATCELHNDAHLQWIRQFPERLLGFAVANPVAGQAALDNLKACLDAGLCGLGEFLPQIQGYTLRHPNFQKIVELAIEYAVPINLHVTEPVGHDYPGRVTTPLDDYVWLAEQYPECTFIFAHWGGLLPFYEMNRKVKKSLHNVYYDTAASPLLYAKTIYRRVIDTIGAERILFGSDYPLLLKPQKSQTPSMTPILEEIDATEINDKEKNMILFQNAQKALRLND